ncbi:MAG: ORF6C domain-containing protein [Gorillibacterium sp.]|nr:ORF6C domain-containing protein [Gorillibacterium sp.]
MSLLRNDNEPDYLALAARQMTVTEQQGQAIRSLIQGMQSIHADMIEKHEETQIMVQEVRDSIVLTDMECYQLQAEVFSKSNDLTKDRYKESDASFKALVGRYRRLIWSKLKEQFSVAKYSHIRRIDFDEAMDFVKSFRPEDHI